MIKPDPIPGAAPSLPPRPRARGALILAIVSALLVWLPFAGYLGLIAALWALAVYKETTTGRTVVSVILGLFGTAGAVFWTVLAMSSCPHVYAHDGEGYRLDADMLSGALFRGAESEDLVRLEHAKDLGGRYRIRIADERDERDFLDRAELWLVDHPRDLEPLPTPGGRLPLLREPLPPTSAVDEAGRDRLAQVLRSDGAAWTGEPSDHDPAAPAEPRSSLTLAFPAVARGEATCLVLRARNTAFATEAFYRYLGRVGPGLGTLLEWAQSSQTYPYRQRLQDEIQRMQMPLRIEICAAGACRRAGELGPVGPAALRDVALPLEGLEDFEGQDVEVRLSAPPLFWEIDRAALAKSAGDAEARRLSPSQATGPRGAEVAAVLSGADGRRAALEQGEALDLIYEAPAPVAGQSRSVFFALRGYYEPRIGGRGWLDPVALYRLQKGEDSLARYVLREARERR